MNYIISGLSNITDDELFGMFACFIFSLGPIWLVWSMDRESKKPISK